MDFAIVGMDCLLPGSPDAERWIAATEPAIGPVPKERWPTRTLENATPGTPDRTVSRLGAWLEGEPDGLIPWTRKVIGTAMDEARVDPESTHLFLANLSLPSTAAARALDLSDLDHRPKFLKGHKDSNHSASAAFDAAHHFRLRQATALDAACASGLYAVRLAADALATGACDTAIAAGVQACDPSYLLIGFSQLLALSPTGTPKPLDREANGLVVGEGAAAVVLKRLGDALRNGDRIHAVLRGGGLGNDGRKGNLLAPDARGQLRTLRAAWKTAELDPRECGYIECHATGTALGDSTEIRSMRALLEEAGPIGTPVAIGSAKALVGHTVTVAGLAGLIRAVGAVRDGFIPKGADNPLPVLAESTHLRSASAREPWPVDVPRRAAVSAFGFGGTNAHLIVEGPPPPTPTPAPSRRPPSRQGRFGIRAGLKRILERSPDAPPEPSQIPAAPPPQALSKTPKLAILGISGQLGTLRNASLFDAIREGRMLADADGRNPIEAVHLDPRRWRMPPLELADLLPQQLLAMEIGRDALEASGVAGKNVGVIFGMGLDPTAAEQIVRWAADAPERAPALTAQRVQGQLPNFVANRLSAQLDLEGPSYTVSAGAASGLVALQHAARHLATDAVDAVLVGVSDAAAPSQGAIALVVCALDDADPEQLVATLDLTTPSHPIGAPEQAGETGVLDGLLALLTAVLTDAPGATSQGPGQAIALGVRTHRAPETPEPTGERPLVVVNGRPKRTGTRFGPGLPTRILFGDATPQARPLVWPVVHAGAVDADRSPSPSLAPSTVATPTPLDPRPDTSPVPEPILPPGVAEELQGLGELATALSNNASRVATVHAQFLESQHAAAAQIAAVGQMLQQLDPAGLPLAPSPPSAVLPTQPAPSPRPTAATPSPVPIGPVPPRRFDREALLRHASGALSEVFGSSAAHLDRYEPRTRMPEPPMLLCSRVLSIEGEPDTLGPSRIVTEYDLPTDESWSHHDGKPNACVIVESGQADLFLVSWLGIEAHCKGERIYRLLDCDLTFRGPRPNVGETLHHDIRIKRFARLGGTILFYFEYDCTSNTDGRAVLTMRNGVAGFFTPEELATPQGVDHVPPPLDARPPAVQPLRHTSVTALDAAGVQRIVDGEYSAAFGPGFADADGSQLTLPDSEWRLVHQIDEVRTTGGPYGLGVARYTQVLRDDDWFNACHFKGDPCMPGTLMLEGCLQAVQVWLIGAGVPAEHPQALFEPLPDLPMELRCRGQVVPGHSTLVYEARIKEARLDGSPYAIADVLLSVDGTPVVLAKNVGVTLGLRDGALAKGAPTPPPRSLPEPVPTEDNPGAAIGPRRIYEYSIGDAERAFGAAYRDYRGESPRCARMPGPPLLQMTRVRRADRPGDVRQGAVVAIDYDVPPNGWFFETLPGTSMPFAILLETALQPCGWLTAWQAMGIRDGRDLYFRNLGGKATLHQEIWPDAGTLITETTQTVVAESAGLLIQNFALEVTTAAGAPVYSCTTSFGYFTAAALDGQKGLGLKDETRRSEERTKGSGRTEDLRDHPSMPRSDWRNLDTLTVINETGGKSGLGFYEAEKIIDPDEWFFTAHFYLDPVMPGSLGLEAALQLARFVLQDRTGYTGRTTPIRLHEPHEWKYRGQVRRPVKRMTVELEVTRLTEQEIRFDAVLRADGMPIYELIDFGISAVGPRALPALPEPQRGPHVAALLDTFEVHGDSGTGVLHLDPERFPWLADHCPTVTAPALPMAFAAEIAAEAALLVRPGKKVVGVPTLDAEKWIHTGEGPVDVLVIAVADGDHVAVSLAVHEENPRFPKLSGPKVHMKAVVQLGDDWPSAPEVSMTLPGARPVEMSIETYYGGGLTFHGPSLQGMTDLGHRSERGALATFRTKPDAELNGHSAAFVLDPLLLDTATHPMVSGEPELWSPDVAPGHLAYPVKAEGMVFYGPRPHGDVQCRLDLVDANAHTLTFDVVLVGKTGPWCSFRWTEALVPGGPVLGHPTAVRHRFVWEGIAIPEVAVGTVHQERFRVETADLIEPIPGTLLGLLCTAAELTQWRAAPDRRKWELTRLAAKGATRTWLQRRLGRDVHPRDLEMLDLRDALTIVTQAPSLTAQELIDHLGPTRFTIHTTCDGTTAEAWITER